MQHGFADHGCNPNLTEDMKHKYCKNSVYELFSQRYLPMVSRHIPHLSFTVSLGEIKLDHYTHLATQFPQIAIGATKFHSEHNHHKNSSLK
jgi:hypothetical protein